MEIKDISLDIKNSAAFKAGMEAYKQQGDSNYFIYRPEQSDNQPVMVNVDIGYKLSNGFWSRQGKRKLRIKRFGKTKTKIVTKMVWQTYRILNDNWIHNLQYKLD